MSMLIALRVFMAVIMSAPASTATLASSTTSTEPTPTLTEIGLLVFTLTVFTILLTASGSSPTSVPILDTWGQERLISYPRIFNASIALTILGNYFLEDQSKQIK